ncbi:MAG: signal peptidase I [Pseudohongiellaceae bacterium]
MHKHTHKQALISASQRLDGEAGQAHAAEVVGWRRLRGGVWRVWVENRKFVVVLGCIIFFKTAIADLNSISGASMQPTLLDGDKIWVNKLAYDVRIPFTGVSLAERSAPQRGDIVIIDSSTANKRLVKRIVGIPGDIIHIQNNLLVINGVAADYEILAREDDALIILEQLADRVHQAQLSPHYMNRVSRSDGPDVVPEGQYYVLGDNRDNSADSRVHGFIPRGEIVGRSSSVVFSLDRENSFLPRSKRFFAALD